MFLKILQKNTFFAERVQTTASFFLAQEPATEVFTSFLTKGLTT